MSQPAPAVKFTRRNDIEEARAPEVQRAFRALQDAIAKSSTISRELRGMVFVVSSLSSGCRHCQSHGAYGLAKTGMPVEKIRALWEYETSPLFSESAQCWPRPRRPDASWWASPPAGARHHEPHRGRGADRRHGTLVHQ